MRATQKCPTYKSRLSLERDLSRIPVLFFVPDNHSSSDAPPLAANPKMYSRIRPLGFTAPK